MGDDAGISTSLGWGSPMIEIAEGRFRVRMGGWLLSLGTLLLVPAAAEAAPVIAAPFAADYTLADLGPAAGVPDPYGGLVFKAGDPNTLLLGGTANTADGGMYSVPVTRDVGGHIVGLGAGTFVAPAPYNDGGFAYGPGGVLFLSQWPVNGIAQYKPGSIPGAGPDKTQDLTPLGVPLIPFVNSHAALQFIPSTFPGAGEFKGLSWESGEFYTFTLAPDGTGTYNVTSATLETTIGGGPEGFCLYQEHQPRFCRRQHARFRILG